MCKYINKILCDSPDNLSEISITFITEVCSCDECKKNYKKVQSIIIIRRFMIKYLKKNNIYKKLKSISDNNIIFNYKPWMINYYNNINNLNNALNL